MKTRSEARTDKGWQGFDRMAGLVSLFLVLLLLAVSLFRTGIVEAPFGGTGTEQAAPLATDDSSAPQPADPVKAQVETAGADTTDSSAGSNEAAAVSSDQSSPAFERIETYIDSPVLAGEPDSAAQQRKRQSAGDASLVVPILELRADNGKLSIDGIIGSEQTRKKIVRAALERFGMRNITDRIAVSAGIGSFSWTSDPKDILVLIGTPEQATSVRIDGNSVTLTGQVRDRADKEARGLAAQQLFGAAASIDNRIRVAGDSPSEPSTSASTDQPATPAKIDIANAGQPIADTNKPQAAATVSAEDSPEGEPPEDGNTILTAEAPKNVKASQCARIATGLVIPFLSGRSELTDDGRAALKAVAPCLERRRYIVGGHTDSRGSAIGNLVLSQARAQAVVDFLVSEGVPTDQLIPKGYGETRPVDTNRNEKGRARNRRIDFRFAN